MMSRKPSTAHFVRTVKAHYRAHGRVLPWRSRPTPYRVLVSEFMLQQTQVDRVVPKFTAFIRKFPTVRSLAASSLRDVLVLWQGLGYNRRAKMLHECAKAIVAEHRGSVPRSYGELTSLPGIGPYTAAAIMAFAHNEPLPLIETNVRTAYLHHFFKGRSAVFDRELMPLITATLDRTNPREWYAALMDYGAHLKREVGNENHRSASYARQSRFKGSRREMRGAILRALASGKILTEARLRNTVAKDIGRSGVEKELSMLAREGLVQRRSRGWSLP